MDAPLNGIVAFFPKQYWKMNVESRIREIQGSLSLGDGPSYQSIETTARTAIDNLFPYSRFSLKRDGEITIQIGNVNQYPSQRTRELAAQHYFFIRDITHKHQHHSPSTDTIIDVYPWNQDKKNRDWQRKVLSSLYRSALIARRSRKQNAGAAGILVYANKFIDICRTSSESPFYKKLDLNNLIRSIKIEIEARTERHEVAFNTRSFLLSIAFSVIALAISAIALLQLAPDKFKDATVHPHYIKVAHLLLKDPYPFALLGLCLIFIPIFYPWHHEIRASQYLLRLLHYLKRKVVAIILGIFVGITLYPLIRSLYAWFS